VRTLRTPWRAVAGWGLWQAPRHVVVYVLVVGTVALGASTATAFLLPVTRDDWIRFGLLGISAAVYIELTRTIERQREFVAGTGPYLDTKSVWSFAALLICPPALATAMVVLTYAIAWLRVWPRRRPVPLYRWTFSCATVLCGTQAAVAVLALGMSQHPGVPQNSLPTGLADLAVIAVAAALRWMINCGLVFAAILVSSPQIKPAQLFDNFSEHFLEAGAFGLGLVAATLVVGNPLVLAGVVVALVAMHRGVLLVQFRRAARTDAKTGLYSPEWWHQMAQRALERADVRGTGMAVLMLDLDHFKAVNDTHGHLAGDRVLRAVAQELAGETRDYDTAGRFGGEEFIVLLPEGDAENVRVIAERIRRRVHALVIPATNEEGQPVTITDLTVSIGAALYPSTGISTLEELLQAADAALYEAKDNGRNRTQLATSRIPTQSRPLPSE
jgi:diguanylate cyclase (GGDEF)-like protein